MARVKTIIDVSINTGTSAANLRSLQDQVNSFFATLNKGSLVQSHFAQTTTKDFMELVNASKTFTAEQMRLTTAAKRLDDTLSKGRGTLGQYFNAAFRKNSAEASAAMALANQRAQALETQFIQTSSAVNGFKDVIAIRPLQAFNREAAVTNELMSIKRAMFRQATTSMINFGKNTQWAGRQLMVGFTVPMTIFGTTAGRVFKEIDQAAVRFKKVYGDAFTTPEQLEENMRAVQGLAQEFTKYGIAVKDTIGLAAEAAASGAQNAQLISATTEATRLATLGQLEQQDALTATIALQNAFKLGARELAQEIDFLNMVENQTVVTLQDLSQAIPIVAPVIVGLGGDVRDLAAMLAAMQEGGVGAAQAANALKSGLGSLINPSKEASKNLAAMGISLDAIVEANRGDLMGTVKAFAQALSTLDDFSRQQALEDVFGKYQYARLGALFDNIIGKGTQASRVMELAGMSATQMGAAAAKELNIIAEATSTKFTAAIERFKLSIAPIGEMFMKLASPIVNLFATIFEKFNQLPSFMKNFALIGAVIVGVVVPAGTMFLGLLMNLVGTLAKFTQLTGIATKGFQKGGLFGAISEVTQALRYSSLAEIDAANAAQQLGDSSSEANRALSDHVDQLGDTTTALQDLSEAYQAVIEKQLEMARLVPQVYGPASVAAAATAAAGPVEPRTPIPPQNRNKGGSILAFNSGNTVPGTGNKDTVPAMLTPGEFVVNKKQTQKNLPLLQAINSGQMVKRNKGGSIPRRYDTGSDNGVERLTLKERVEAERLALLHQREQSPTSSGISRGGISVPGGTRTLDQLTPAELQQINDRARPFLQRRGIQEDIVTLLGTGVVPLISSMNDALRRGVTPGPQAEQVFSNPALYGSMLSTAAAQTQLAIAGVGKSDIQGFVARGAGAAGMGRKESVSDAYIYSVIEDVLGSQYGPLYEAIRTDAGAGRFGLSTRGSAQLAATNTVDKATRYGEVLVEMLGPGNVRREAIGKDSGFVLDFGGDIGTIAVVPGKTFTAKTGKESYERMPTAPGTVRAHIMPGVSPAVFSNSGGMIPGIQYLREGSKKPVVDLASNLIVENPDEAYLNTMKMLNIDMTDMLAVTRDEYIKYMKILYTGDPIISSWKMTEEEKAKSLTEAIPGMNFDTKLTDEDIDRRAQLLYAGGSLRIANLANIKAVPAGYKDVVTRYGSSNLRSNDIYHGLMENLYEIVHYKRIEKVYQEMVNQNNPLVANKTINEFITDIYKKGRVDPGANSYELDQGDGTSFYVPTNARGIADPTRDLVKPGHDEKLIDDFNALYAQIAYGLKPEDKIRIFKGARSGDLIDPETGQYHQSGGWWSYSPLLAAGFSQSSSIPLEDDLAVSDFPQAIGFSGYTDERAFHRSPGDRDTRLNQAYYEYVLFKESVKKKADDAIEKLKMLSLFNTKYSNIVRGFPDITNMTTPELVSNLSTLIPDVDFSSLSNPYLATSEEDRTSQMNKLDQITGPLQNRYHNEHKEIVEQLKEAEKKYKILIGQDVEVGGDPTKEAETQSMTRGFRLAEVFVGNDIPYEKIQTLPKDIQELYAHKYISGGRNSGWFQKDQEKNTYRVIMEKFQRSPIDDTDKQFIDYLQDVAGLTLISRKSPEGLIPAKLNKGGKVPGVQYLMAGNQVQSQKFSLGTQGTHVSEARQVQPEDLESSGFSYLQILLAEKLSDAQVPYEAYTYDSQMLNLDGEINQDLRNTAGKGVERKVLKNNIIYHYNKGDLFTKLEQFGKIPNPASFRDQITRNVQNYSVKDDIFYDKEFTKAYSLAVHDHKKTLDKDKKKIFNQIVTASKEQVKGAIVFKRDKVINAGHNIHTHGNVDLARRGARESGQKNGLYFWATSSEANPQALILEELNQNEKTANLKSYDRRSLQYNSGGLIPGIQYLMAGSRVGIPGASSEATKEATRKFLHERFMARDAKDQGLTDFIFRRGEDGKLDLNANELIALLTENPNVTDKQLAQIAKYHGSRIRDGVFGKFDSEVGYRAQDPHASTWRHIARILGERGYPVINAKKPGQKGSEISPEEFLNIGGMAGIRKFAQGGMPEDKDKLEEDLSIQAVAQKLADNGWSKLTDAEKEVLKANAEQFVGPKLYRGTGAASEIMDPGLRAALIAGDYQKILNFEGDMIPFPKGSWSTDARVAEGHMQYSASENQEWANAIDMLTVRGSVPLYGSTYKEHIKGEQANVIRKIKDLKDQLKQAQDRMSPEAVAQEEARIEQLRLAVEQERKSARSKLGFTEDQDLTLTQRAMISDTVRESKAQRDYDIAKQSYKTNLEYPTELQRRIDEQIKGLYYKRNARKQAFAELERLRQQGSNIQVLYEAEQNVGMFIPRDQAKIDYVMDLTNYDNYEENDPFITKVYKFLLKINNPDMVDISGVGARYGATQNPGSKMNYNEYEWFRANRGGAVPLQYFANGGMANPMQAFATGNVFESSKKNYVPGSGNKDTVPAALTPGEFVINKKATAQNLGLLKAINSGQMVARNKGGIIPGVQYFEEGNLVVQPALPGMEDSTIRQEASSIDELNTLLDELMEKRKEALIEEISLQGNFDEQRKNLEEAHKQELINIVENYNRRMEDLAAREVSEKQRLQQEITNIQAQIDESTEQQVKNQLEADKRMLEAQLEGYDERLKAQRENALAELELQKQSAEKRKNEQQQLIEEADKRTSDFEEMTIGGESVQSLKKRFKEASGAGKFKVGLGAATAGVGAATAGYSTFASAFGVKNEQLEKNMSDLTTGLGLATTAASLIPGPFGVVAGVAAGLGYGLKVLADRTNEAAAKMADAGANLGHAANALETTSKMLGVETPAQRMAKLQVGLTPKVSEELSQNKPYQSMISTPEGQKVLEELKNATSADRMKKVGDIIAYGIASGAMTKEDAKLFGKGIAAELADPAVGIQIGKNISENVYVKGFRGLGDLAGERRTALADTGLLTTMERTLRNRETYLAERPTPVAGRGGIVYGIPGMDAAQSAQIIASSIQGIKDWSSAMALAKEELTAGTISQAEYNSFIEKGREAVKQLESDMTSAAQASNSIGVTMGAVKNQLVTSGQLTEEQFTGLEEAARATGQSFDESRELVLSSLSAISSGAMNAATALDLVAQITQTGLYEGQDPTAAKKAYDKALAGGMNQVDAQTTAQFASQLEAGQIIAKDDLSKINTFVPGMGTITGEQQVQDFSAKYIAEFGSSAAPALQQFLMSLTSEQIPSIVPKLLTMTPQEAQSFIDTINTAAAYYTDVPNQLLNDKTFTEANPKNQKALQTVIGEAGAAGVTEKVMQFALRSVDEDGETVGINEQINNIKSYTKAQKQIDKIPDEVKKSLKIDLEDPKDVLDFGGMSDEQVAKLNANYTLLDSLPDNINKDAVARFALMDSQGNPLSAKQVIDQINLITKNFNKLEKVKGKNKIELGVQIMQTMTDLEGNPTDSEEARQYVDSLINEYGSGKVTKLPPEVYVATFQFKVNIEGLKDLLLAKRIAYQEALNRSDFAEAGRIADEIRGITAQIDSLNAQIYQAMNADYKTTSGGGGGTKSLLQQLQDEFKYIKQLFEAMKKYVDTNKDEFIKLASGPFAPEYIEFLKSQGEEGLKILKEGGDKFEKGLKIFSKKAMYEARTIGYAFGAITNAQTKAVQGQNSIIQSLIEGGMGQEAAQQLVDTLGPGFARAFSEGDKEAVALVKRIINTKDATRVFELAVENTIKTLNSEANTINNINGLLAVNGVNTLENATKLNELGINAKFAAENTDILASILKQIDSINIAQSIQSANDSLKKMGDEAKITQNIIEALGANATPELVDSIKQLNVTTQWTSTNIREAGSALAYVARETEKAKTQFQQATELSDAWSAALQAQVEKINRLEIRPIEKAITVLQNKIGGIQDEIDVLRDKEKEIQKVYDDRVKALEAVANVNQRIIDQQKGQLDVASALSRGDVAGAAQAALGLQQTMAQGRMDDTREALDTQFESERLDITTQIEEKEKSIKAINDEIELKQKEIEKIKERQLALEEKMYNLALLKSAVEARSAMIDAARRKDKSEYEAYAAQLTAINAVGGANMFDAKTFGEQAAASLQNAWNTTVGQRLVGFDAAAAQFNTQPGTVPGQISGGSAITITGPLIINGVQLTSDQQTAFDAGAGGGALGRMPGSTVTKPQGGRGKGDGAAQEEPAQEEPMTPDDVEEIFTTKFSDLAKVVKEFLGEKGLSSVLVGLVNGMVELVNGFFDAVTSTLNTLKITIPPIAVTIAYSDAEGTKYAGGSTLPTSFNINPLKTIVQGLMYGGNVNYKGSKERAPGFAFGGRMKKYAMGSFVPGMGMTDKVPALLTPGEFVVRKPVAQQIGPLLSAINSDVFPKVNLGTTTPKATNNPSNPVQYNYNVEVNVAGTNASPDDIANAVMFKINSVNDRNLRSIKINGNS